MRSVIKYSLLYVILSFGLLFSFYSIFQITPTGDDYWYSALLKEHGFIGGMSVFLGNFSGFFFKELLSFIFVSSIAYLPIGLGSGLSFFMISLLATVLMLIIVAVYAGNFWNALQINDKIILLLSTLLFNLLVNTMWYKNQRGHFFGGLEDQVYDLTFWISMQVNYIAVTSVLFIWFILLQRSNRNKIYYINMLLFGLALGTSHYTLTAIFWSFLILVFILNKLNASVIKIKLKDSKYYFISSLLGVVSTFAFPSTIKRMNEAAGGNNFLDYGDPTKNNFLDIGSYNISYYFGNLLNPSLLIMSAFIIIITILLSNRFNHTNSVKLFKLGFLLLVVAFIGFVIAYIIDHLTVHYAWHYNHSIFLIRLALFLISISIGIKIGQTINSDFVKGVLFLGILGCIYMPLVTQNSVIESRFDCWLAGDCRVGNAPEIDTFWFYEQWLIWKKYTELPDRKSSLEEFI